MADATVDYDAPDLAARIEQLSQDQIDHLPLGVVLLNAEGVVTFYSATEKRLSGYVGMPLGRNFFDIAPCVSKGDIRGRIAAAQEQGMVDLEFALAGDHVDRTRGVRVRVQSARQGGVWLFLQRD
jgi:photoactive yellow protein